ncbi:Down syndrome cell adhesion molecule-like protein Dscam2 [Thrips palmi]|uniref:Down syndrome cell adhesion molecule-like protein Dscam2 n=1 Tax=Thrips palmi TaxID=161013 RepID=A0A6P9A869_THRPL|nr:Down syndrome cell adhesion molecule-like protein Dscam2 [Thrips palmi]
MSLGSPPFPKNLAPGSVKQVLQSLQQTKKKSRQKSQDLGICLSPFFQWFRVDRAGQSVPVVASPPRVRQVQGSLVLQAVTLADAGLYMCAVNNSVGTERVSTSVVINAPLAAYISPQVQTVDVDRTAYFNCTTEGHPQISVSWLKNGKQLSAGKGVQILPGHVLRLESVQRADGGMYQCFVSNGQEAAQGSAHLRLGDAAPMLLATFPNETLSPGFTVV